MPVAFEPFLKHIPLLILVFFRLTGLFIVTPILSSRTIPMQIRILLTFVMSLSIYPALAPLNGGSEIAPEVREASMAILNGGSALNIYALPLMVAMEVMIGFVIGFSVLILMMALQVGGDIIDQQMGMGFAGIYNPEMNAQAGVTSQLFFLIATTVFIIVGGHRELFRILLDSFSTIPIGGFKVDSKLLTLVLGLMQTTFELGVRVGGPILVIVFLETVALGMIARTVPQMNILSIGFPLRILMGMVMLVALLGMVSHLFQEHIVIVLSRLREFVAPVEAVQSVPSGG